VVTPRSTTLLVALLLLTAAVPALLLHLFGYDFLFYTDRPRQKNLAWAALLLPLLSVPVVRAWGWDARAAAGAERLARLWIGAGGRARALFLIAIFATGVFVAIVLLQRFYNSADEYAYVFQAETYARGRIWLDPHPLHSFVQFMHGKLIDGKWVSRFPPGWPVFMAPFVAVGIPPWLINPLVGAASVALLYAFARRRYGERVALLAAAVFALSGFFILNSGSYYSHPLAALLSLAFVAAAARYLERPSLGWALAAGLSVGFLGLSRHMNAAVLFPPFLLALAARRSLRHWARAWPLALGALLFLAALLAYNWSITGDPLVLPTTVDDPKQGIGFFGKHTPARAVKFMQLRLLLLPRYTSGLFLFLYGVALAIGAARRELRWWDAYFVLELLGYSLYHNAAHNLYGPRYLYEAFPFAALRIAIACVAVGNGRVSWRPVFTWLVSVHLVCALISALTTGRLHQKIVDERRDPYRLVEKAGLRNAVVFIASDTGVIKRMPRFDLIRNGLDVDRRSVIYAHFQPNRLDAITAYYPERSFWVYSREKDRVQGALTPLEEWSR
jgi:4-amino-4-deoxy-L-arabinose transferase-like glycosyltransferase